jgi:hypothetical protein
MFMPRVASPSISSSLESVLGINFIHVYLHHLANIRTMENMVHPLFFRSETLQHCSSPFLSSYIQCSGAVVNLSNFAFKKAWVQQTPLVQFPDHHITSERRSQAPSAKNLGTRPPPQLATAANTFIVICPCVLLNPVEYPGSATHRFDGPPLYFYAQLITECMEFSPQKLAPVIC